MELPIKVKTYKMCNNCKYYKFNKTHICTKGNISILSDLIACINYRKSITNLDKMIRSSNKCIKIIDKMQNLLKELINENFLNHN